MSVAVKHKKIIATKSTRYRKFIADRDKALEVILNKSRAMMHDALRGTFQNLKEKLAYKFSVHGRDSMALDTSHFLKSVEEEIANEFKRSSEIVLSIILRMSMYSYALSLTGEAEAIGQAKDKRTKYSISRDDALEAALSMPDGKSTAERVRYAFDKLKRAILNAVQLSKIEGSAVHDMLDRVDRAQIGRAHV